MDGAGRPPAEQAEAHLAAGRFRQAVDAYKDLSRTDPETYRSRLREAYEGLYKQRLAKGMVEEAAMVLAHIEKLSGDRPGPDRVRLWLKDRAFDKAAAVASDLITGQQSLSDPERACVADALVVAFDTLPQPNELPDSVAVELARVHESLQAIGAEDYDRAMEAMKALGLRSLFNSWRWLVKGLCAFYGHQDEKALAAFGKIAPGTVAEAFALPYARLLDGAGGKQSKISLKEASDLEDLCVVAGYGTVAPVMARADYLWRVGRFRDSHAHLCSGWEAFPSFVTGPARTLSEFYYNSCLDMSSEQARKYFGQLARSAEARRNDQGAETLWTRRTFALFLQRTSANDDHILSEWENLLREYTGRYGDRPILRAMVHKQLGDLFARQMPDDRPFPFFSRRHRKHPHIRNSELAQSCYEKSLAAAPGEKQTHLALIDFYEKLGNGAKVNKLLDQLIKQFPDEKEILYKAGLRCAERKALGKAIKYLEQAVALDPMDKRVREGYITAGIKAAHDYALKRQAAKCRELLPRVLAVAESRSGDFNRGGCYLYARWSAFEQLMGDTARAEALWSKAMAPTPDGDIKLRFFYWVMARYYGVASERLTEHQAMIREAMDAEVRVQVALAFAETLLYVRNLADKPLPAGEIKRINAYIARASRLAMTRQQAQSILSFVHGVDFANPDIAGICIATMLKRDPRDAYFRFERYVARVKARRFFPTFGKEIRELETILELAREQKEDRVAVEVRKRIDELNAMGGWAVAEEEEEEEAIDVEEVTAAALDLLKKMMRSKRTKPKAPGRKKPDTDGGRQMPPGPQQMDLFE